MMEADGWSLSTRIPAIVGILGPVVFTVIHTILGIVSPGYNAASDVISNLELVQHGWVQQLNFLQCGACIAIFGIGVRKSLRSVIQKRLNLVATLLVISGSGMIWASYFTPATPVFHALGFLAFIFPLLISLFIAGKQLLNNTGIARKLGIYTLAAGTTTLIVLFSFFVLGAQAGGPSALVGVTNRLFVTASLSWFVVTGAILMRTRV